VLDAQASTATLGKTAGKDADSNKPTYVSAVGVDAARAMAVELRRDALESLAGFGERARRLGQMADFIVAREF
jgi:farnesyl diphosphate synthase